MNFAKTIQENQEIDKKTNISQTIRTISFSQENNNNKSIMSYDIAPAIGDNFASKIEHFPQTNNTETKNNVIDDKTNIFKERFLKKPDDKSDIPPFKNQTKITNFFQKNIRSIDKNIPTPNELFLSFLQKGKEKSFNTLINEEKKELSNGNTKKNSEGQIFEPDSKTEINSNNIDKPENNVLDFKNKSIKQTFMKQPIKKTKNSVVDIFKKHIDTNIPRIEFNDNRNTERNSKDVIQQIKKKKLNINRKVDTPDKKIHKNNENIQNDHSKSQIVLNTDNSMLSLEEQQKIKMTKNLVANSNHLNQNPSSNILVNLLKYLDSKNL